MTRKELILVIFVLIFAAVGGGLVLALTDGEQPAKKPAAAKHDETNSDGHHSSSNAQSVGDEVDLTSQSAVSIDIKDFKYSKSNIKVRKGTTVTWTNQDAVEHNAMKDHQDSGGTHDAPTANEVKPDVFAGPLLKKGESYSFTFNEVGTDPYHCAPHPYMKGIVTVVE